MAITKAIKGAVVPVSEITSSFQDSQTALNELTEKGIISPREGGQKFEFLQDFDVSGFKPTTPALKTTTTGGGTSAGGVFSFLKGFVGTETPEVTAETPEIQKYKGEQAEALEAAKQTQYKAFDVARDKELAQLEQDAEKITGETKNKLAELGILGTSTAGMQYLNDIQTDLSELQSGVRTKYEIQKMEIDAKTKQSLLDSVNAKIKDINDRMEKKKENLIKTGTLAVSLFKELSGAEQDKIKNDLEAEKNRITEEYNAGKLTIDEYDAKTKRIESQINSFEAETGRMKEERLAGLGGPRPSYGEFLNTLGSRLGQTLNPESPELKSLYTQAFPMTVNEAKKSLTTEQQSRSEVVQDMIDKGEISLEEAQQIHSDISWMLNRPGLSNFQKLFFGLSGIGTTTPPAEEE